MPPAVLSNDWAAGQADPDSIQPQDFWASIGSPTLRALIDRGLANNASLNAARARVAQARADLRIAHAALLPTVGATGTLSKTRTDNQGAQLFDYSNGTLELDIAYDVDLFGANKAGNRAAAARYAAVGLDTQAAALVVETEIARAVVQQAGLIERIALIDRNIANAQELARIIGVRVREGAANRLDSGLQSVQLSQLMATRATLEDARRKTQDALAVLVGAEAPGFGAPIPPLNALAIPALDPGQPGNLLFRRPDVRAAEARIAAAKGDVQQARAQFLPSLKLSASAIGLAASLAGPFGATLSVGSSLFAPIFEGGRLRGQFDSASARQVESVALYRNVLLVAMREGSDALADGDLAAQRERVLAGAVAEAQRTSRLAHLQYVEGATDLATVLDAERQEIAVEDAHAQARQDRLIAAIDLYKAIGGAPVLQHRVVHN